MYKTALFLCLVLAACSQGARVVIANRSASDKEIRVVYPPQLWMPIDVDNDKAGTVITHDLSQWHVYSADYARSAIAVPMDEIDTAARTYRFHLKAGHKAIVEKRWPTSKPTFGQLFIIDNTDTIHLQKSGSQFIKKPKLFAGGEWTYTINP